MGIGNTTTITSSFASCTRCPDPVKKAASVALFSMPCWRRNTLVRLRWHRGSSSHAPAVMGIRIRGSVIVGFCFATMVTHQREHFVRCGEMHSRVEHVINEIIRGALREVEIVRLR